jgi:hypothetical protein
VTPSGVVSLASSLQPLQEHLNANQKRLRFLAVLFRTWPVCLQGARAVQEAILRSFPQADVSVSIVWSNMLPLDNSFTAGRQPAHIADACVRHFHDHRRRAGKALGESLGARGKTWWDVYIFYGAGSVWEDHPPAPARWAHQLSEAWAAAAQRHRGDDLSEQLRIAMSELVGA